MARFLVLMHDDAPDAEDMSAWGAYLQTLGASGHLQGGSSLGRATRHRRGEAVEGRDTGVVGYLLLDADDGSQVEALLAGNPSYAAGATIDILELVED